MISRPAWRAIRETSAAGQWRCRWRPLDRDQVGAAVAEGVDAGLDDGAGSDVGRARSVPGQEPLAAVGDPVAREARAHHRERVEVPDRDPVRGEVTGDPGECAGELVAIEQVVERVVQAGHEVEGAERRQIADVGHEHAGVRRLARRSVRHLRREVAGRDRVPAVEQREEALAGPAGEVEHPSAAESVMRGDALDLVEPQVVPVVGGEGVVGRRERVVGEPDRVGGGRRRTRLAAGKGENGRHGESACNRVMRKSHGPGIL